MNSIPDKQLIFQLISADDRLVDASFAYLHKTMFHRITRFVLDNNGTASDAKDLFQDGLVVFFKMAKQNKLPEEVVVQAYLFNICRYLWYKVLKKRKKPLELQDSLQMDIEVEPPLTSMISEERRSTIEALFAKIGDDCKKLLVHYYFEQMPLKDVALLMNYASEQVAKNKKSFCMGKLKMLAEQMPGLRDLFIR